MAETSGGDRSRRRSKIAPHDSLYGHEAALRATLPWALALIGGFVGAGIIAAILPIDGLFAGIDAELADEYAGELLYVSIIGLELLFLTIAARGLKRAGIRDAVISVRPVSRTDMKAGVLCALASLVFGLVLGAMEFLGAGLIGQASGLQTLAAADGEAASAGSSPGGLADTALTITYWLTLGIALIVAAPIFEEIVFRGWLQPYLRGIGLSRIAAIGLTAALFGLVHISPLSIVSSSISGVLYGVAREWTGRLAAPMIAHALHNAVVFLVLLIAFYVVV